MNPDLVWGAVAALVIFLEFAGIVGKRKGDTISELTRKYFKTDTPAGATLFGVTWLGFAAWYFWHILWQHPRKKS